MYVHEKMRIKDPGNVWKSSHINIHNTNAQ